MTITPVINSFNEAPNIRRVLSRLQWAERIVVVDSHSTDGTQRICAEFPNVELFERPFKGFAEQCNYGLERVETPWCLFLDSDYIVSGDLVAEMREAVIEGRADGYFARFIYSIRGRSLRGTLYPDRLVLFRKEAGTFVQDGHTQRLSFTGRSETLRHPIIHDDRKPLARWLRSQETYAEQELHKLMRASWRELSWPDRVRSVGVVAPWLAPLYYLFGKGGVRDGWPGLEYAAQRAIAELVLSVKLFEAKWPVDPSDET